MTTLKRDNGKYIVTISSKVSVFDTLHDSLRYIGGFRNATEI